MLLLKITRFDRFWVCGSGAFIINVIIIMLEELAQIAALIQLAGLR